MGLDESFPKEPGIGLVILFEHYEFAGLLEDQNTLKSAVVQLVDGLPRQQQKLFGFTSFNRNPRFARDYVGATLIAAARLKVVGITRDRAVELARSI